MILSFLGIIEDTIFDSENKYDLYCKKLAVGLI